MNKGRVGMDGHACACAGGECGIETRQAQGKWVGFFAADPGAKRRRFWADTRAPCAQPCDLAAPRGPTWLLLHQPLAFSFLLPHGNPLKHPWSPAIHPTVALPINSEDGEKLEA